MWRRRAKVKVSLPVPTKLPEQVTKNKGKDGEIICNISAEVPTVYLSVWLLSYLSTVCAHRTGLCCLLVLAEPPPHYTHPHTGLQLCHRSSVQVMQCRCSYCCCPTTLSHSCGYCQNCASAPAENYRPSCRAWRPKDSRHLNTHI